MSARKVAVCLALAAVTLALYWPATQCGFLCYDDPDYVTENGSVCQGLSWRSGKGVKAAPSKVRP